MSNMGKWAGYYADIVHPVPYGDAKTYEIGAEFLADCVVVEDWGCGTGWFKKIAEPKGLNVTSIDGSYSPFCDRVRDLEHYRPLDVDGIFMRHVLEHNYAWDKILDNALASAKKKLALVLFTPPSNDAEAHQIAWVPGYNVPDLSLPPEVLDQMFHEAGFHVEHRTLKTATWYGEENLYLGTRVVDPDSQSDPPSHL
jgi:hypothetical protein